MLDSRYHDTVLLPSSSRLSLCAIIFFFFQKNNSSFCFVGGVGNVAHGTLTNKNYCSRLKKAIPVCREVCRKY